MVMKKLVRKKDSSELQKTHPISDRVEGWFFRQQENSNCCYVVEGVDLYGHSVSRTGTDPELVLEDCIRDAEEIRRQA
jgi:hypothetical protein